MQKKIKNNRLFEKLGRCTQCGSCRPYVRNGREKRKRVGGRRSVGGIGGSYCYHGDWSGGGRRGNIPDF